LTSQSQKVITQLISTTVIVYWREKGEDEGKGGKIGMK
jgi:hypothetical protein